MDEIITSNKDLIFDNGDVKILISGPGGEKHFGMVCSQAMCLASPVWKKFIYPPFRQLQQDVMGQRKPIGEGNESGSSTISKETENDREGEHVKPVAQLDFTEDDPVALSILLYIAHLDFLSVSRKLDTKELLQVAVLCDQYDCVRLVSMFLSHWLLDADGESKGDGWQRWIFISWAFGRTDIFGSLAKRMLDTAGVSKDGEIVDCDGTVVDCPMPPGITESILEIRQNTIQSLLDTFYSHTERFQNYQKPICEAECMECDASIYGSIILGLDKAGLWPRKTVNEIHVSIDVLSTRLCDLEIYTHHTYHMSHSECNTLNPEDEVTKITKMMGNPVLEVHRRHMATAKSHCI